MADLDSNLARLTPILTHLGETGVMNHIGGGSRPARSGQVFETRSPVDESLIAQVARGDAADVDDAAQAAQAAFPAWRDMEGVARKKLLLRIADAIE